MLLSGVRDDTILPTGIFVALNSVRRSGLSFGEVRPVLRTGWLRIAAALRAALEFGPLVRPLREAFPCYFA